MRTLLFSGVAALALGISGAYAQSTTAQPSPAASASATASGGDFVTQQAAGTFRAPKLVGVAVYDSTNKDIGKIADLLLDKDGKVQTVVVSVGGFLGIGSKDVGVPFSALHWQTEQRTAATNDASGSGSMTGGGTNTASNSSASNAPAAGSGTKTMTAAQTEAYQGYPDRAVIDMSQAQLKAAPDFKYASSSDSTARQQ